MTARGDGANWQDPDLCGRLHALPAAFAQAIARARTVAVRAAEPAADTEAPAGFMAAAKVDTFVLNVRPDPIDFRDRYFEPTLVSIEPFFDPPELTRRDVRRQGQEGSCTGHALAAVIDIQNMVRRDRLAGRLGAEEIDRLVPDRVSARMLYEMARAYDEYPDDGLPGSSARGAIKGFFHNGVCDDRLAPYIDGELGWRLKVAAAKDARKTSLGAYFRLRHVLYDYHAALNEVGALYVTAMVHENWKAPADGTIAFETEKPPKLIGAHAFAIVGYDASHFLVLNSWGPGWSAVPIPRVSAQAPVPCPGVARWSYEDWKAHALDAWVLRLAVPSERTFHLVGGYRGKEAKLAELSLPRIEINGHYIHVDNGRFVKSGNYWNDMKSIRETAKRLRALSGAANPSTGKPARAYEHLLFYAHGGLNTLDAAARRAAIMTPVMKALNIYPVFYFWRTGLFEEMADVLAGYAEKARQRAAGLSELTDRIVEGFARRVVRPIWREMKADAERAAYRGEGEKAREAGFWGHAYDATVELARAAQDTGMRLHLVGHSAGAIFLGEILRRAADDRGAGAFDIGKNFGTGTLYAPACSVETFEDTFSHVVTSLGHPREAFAIYSLSAAREADDSVAAVYRKSLLHLVANALEEGGARTELAGFEAPARDLAKRYGFAVHVAGSDPASGATTHGDFDNDAATLNHTLERVLGRALKPDEGFSEDMFPK